MPETIAGNDFHDAIAIGKFHGVMMPAMPTGARTLIANLSFNSAGVVWPTTSCPLQPCRTPYLSLPGPHRVLPPTLYRFPSLKDGRGVLFSLSVYSRHRT